MTIISSQLEFDNLTSQTWTRCQARPCERKA